MRPQIIRIGTEQRDMPGQLKGCTVLGSLGNFDGVHIGHQSLMQSLREEKEARIARGSSRRVISTLISFYPHPAIVLGRADLPARLTSLREMISILERFNLDYLCLIHFSPRLSEKPAGEFVEQFLLNLLNLDYLIVGQDAAVGRDREGDATFLADAFVGVGRQLVVRDFIEYKGDRVSSGRIRKLLKSGDLDEAEALLGREYAITACVIHGSGRGKQLGFPTVNLNYRGHVIPRIGVYACRVVIDGQLYRAVANVGVRPTFGDGELQVEAHLLDWNQGELYGKRVSLQFVSYLREEKVFENIAALKAQIELDCTEAKKTL